MMSELRFSKLRAMEERERVEIHKFIQPRYTVKNALWSREGREGKEERGKREAKVVQSSLSGAH